MQQFHIPLFSFIHNELEVAVVGPQVDLTYDYEVRRNGLYGSATCVSCIVAI